MFNNKPSFYELEVQFEEIDQGAVVYHPNYLTYMERARNYHMKSVGFSLKRMLEENFVFALAQSDISYKRPCKLHDTLVVSTLVDQIKSASVTVTQIIYNNTTTSHLEKLSIEELLKAENIAVKATIKLACIDLQKFKPIKIPDELTDLLTKNL